MLGALGGSLALAVAGSALRLAGVHSGVATGLSFIGLVASGLVVTVVLARRGWLDHGSGRRSWWMLAASPAMATVWIVGMFGRALQSGASPAHASGQVGHLISVPSLISVPFLIVGLLGLPTPKHDTRARIRAAMDVVATACAFGVLTYSLAMPSGADRLSAFHPLLDMLLGTVVIAALGRARFEGGVTLPVLLSVCGGVVLIGASDALMTHLLATGNWSVQNPYLLLAAVGRGLLAFGALQPVDARDSVPMLRRRERVGVLAPVLPVVGVGAVAFASMVSKKPLATVATVLLVAVALLILVSWVLARLDQLVLSRTLEHRVIERTLALRTHATWFRSLVQNSSDVITIIDPSGTIRYQTPSADRVLGYDPTAMVGQNFVSLLAPGDGARLEAILVDAALRPRSMHTMEFAILHNDGHWCETETVVTSLVDDPDIRGLVLNTRDVSERKELERQLTRQAFSDSLTGLANRALFSNRVEHALLERSRKAGEVAVLFLDLDGFKGVNDAQGHAVGDHLLTLVADRLRQCVRPGDTVARLGGDEFAILVVGPDAEHFATQVAERIRAVLAQPFVLSGREVMLAGSVGIAVTDNGDETADQVLRNADLAMYRAKASRDGGYVRFRSEMHDALLVRVQAEADLRHALARGQLVLHYQPTVNLRTGQVVGVEALIRWYHPERGIVQPMDFIGLAEETGLVESIGEWAVRECCRQGARWQAYAPAGAVFHVAVNVSSRQLNPNLPIIVRDALAQTGMPPGALVIEMTESVLIERTDEAVQVLRELKDLGTRIAIDDFGTGYSSLSYLARFPVDILKIDKSFVEQLHIREDDAVLSPSGPSEPFEHSAHPRQNGSDAAELARTIVHLGRSLRLGTVAEGIETREQYVALVNMACDYGQGFLFSRPLPGEGIDTLFSHLLVSTLPTPQVVYRGREIPA